MNDQARLFIAIAISFLVFFVWQLFFVEKDKEMIPPPQPGKEAPITTGQPYVAEKETPTVQPAQPEAPALPQKETPTLAEPAKMIDVQKEGGG